MGIKYLEDVTPISDLGLDLGMLQWIFDSSDQISPIDEGLMSFRGLAGNIWGTNDDYLRRDQIMCC